MTKLAKYMRESIERRMLEHAFGDQVRGVIAEQASEEEAA